MLKNLTTSPFSQRKQTVPPQPELPPMLVEKRAPHFASHHQPQQQQQLQQPYSNYHQSPLQHHHHHHRPAEAAAVVVVGPPSQFPRHVFQNSPILQRRNPSYITYGDCNNASPSKGRGGSANTSPIGRPSIIIISICTISFTNHSSSSSFSSTKVLPPTEPVA